MVLYIILDSQSAKNILIGLFGLVQMDPLGFLPHFLIIALLVDACN